MQNFTAIYMKNNKKIFVEKIVFTKIDYEKPIKPQEYLHLLLGDDILDSGWEEGHYSENNSCDGHFSVTIARKVLETDAEYELRKKIEKTEKEHLRTRRFETYLKLKKEFEDEN